MGIVTFNEAPRSSRLANKYKWERRNFTLSPGETYDLLEQSGLEDNSPRAVTFFAVQATIEVDTILSNLTKKAEGNRK